MDRNKILSNRVIELKIEVAKLKEENAVQKDAFKSLFTRYEESTKFWSETCDTWEEMFDKERNLTDKYYKRFIWTTSIYVFFSLILYFLKG